jgi:hypothetical protein
MGAANWSGVERFAGSIAIIDHLLQALFRLGW